MRMFQTNNFIKSISIAQRKTMEAKVNLSGKIKSTKILHIFKDQMALFKSTMMEKSEETTATGK
jgi:hypothetical protein